MSLSSPPRMACLKNCSKTTGSESSNRKERASSLTTPRKDHELVEKNTVIAHHDNLVVTVPISVFGHVTLRCKPWRSVAAAPPSQNVGEVSSVTPKLW